MRRRVLLLGLLALPGPAAAQRRGRSAEALEAARRFLCPNGGTPQGRGRCAPSARTGGLSSDVDPAVRGWDRGIAPATRAQRPCPEGTRADTAVANPGVTRCVPA